MKLVISFLLIALLPIQWEPDFENAKKTAKEKHQLILLNFSGSDWCGPCIMMRKEYLESDAFTKVADGNLVLVNADFPRKKKNIPAPDVVKRNEALAEKYNKKGIFPLTLLLNADGKVLKTWEGKPEASLETWTSEIKSICESNK
ncbi:MAG: thiol-disulfide isomerase [Flavobacterium sp. BFFFF1]|uniref:thioredoxin family protein n=1 Tax=unclassified Flavobacterium TaxID=196869 RepID=UPI000BCDA5F9|nr:MULTISPECIES: thioredoxin family protein [unclassified Flavobacterium]OYU81094.1 MAG: thiol-disulfide isomerase [Flavobacterium sp. BFFFF1]